MAVNVYIAPRFAGVDTGDGGIRRVVEAQHKWLPAYGVQVVESHEDAHVLALHAGTWPEGKIAPQTPIVAHCHGLYWEGYEWAKWAKALNQDVIRTLRQADVVTAPSDWVGMALKRGMWADALTLYHGIEPDDWQTVEKPSDYVLWNKNRVDSICTPEPVNKLAELAPDVHFVSTHGQGAANLEITGTQPYADAKRFVKQAFVYMATSRETFGIGTLEAMAAGAPVLGWRWGGQAEIVRHLVDGYLAEPGDYDDLLAGLRFCIERRNELGTAARTWVLSEFTNEKRIKPYADLYARLADEASKRLRFSVIMPYYNLSKYVAEAVNSVTSQLTDQDELIIVDDASPEPLPSLALPANFRIVRHEKNEYLAETLNHGIHEARGRYVINLDADNLIAPGTLSILADALDADRGLDIAYGKMEVFNDLNEKERFVSNWPPAEAHPGLQLAHANQITSTAMYRRTVWERTGGYRRRCHTAEDADFWSRALSVGFRARRVTDAPVLIYRDRGDSMSRQQKDWDWHKWYSYATDTKLRLFAAGGENIPTHEFPLVSVVIPVGPGHERFVLDALDSLQNQTFRHWEAVVVNDTGHPIPWLPAWAREVKPQPGMRFGGAGSARNEGLRHAKGKYIAFLDADDWLHTRALDLMYNTILQTGGFVYVGWYHAEKSAQKHAKKFDPDSVLKGLAYPVTCMYDRTELAEKQIWFDENFDGKGWEDWDFQLQVVAEHGICGYPIDAPLLHYRYDTGSLRESAFASQKQMEQEILDKWGEYIAGRKENMAKCGGCGGLRPPEYDMKNGQMPATTQANGSAEEVVDVEYTGGLMNKQTYIGRASGTRYKFSNDDDDHRVRRVFKTDVPGLLALGVFRVKPALIAAGALAGEFEPLRADGPPRRNGSALIETHAHPADPEAGLPAELLQPVGAD